MGEVKLNSTLLYGRAIITTEERFLENLNKYIGYVRDHYFINHIEQFCLIETSLTNKYTNPTINKINNNGFHLND